MHSKNDNHKENEKDPQADEPVPLLPGKVSPDTAATPDMTEARDTPETALIRPSTLQLYLSRIRQYALLTPEEEHCKILRGG